MPDGLSAHSGWIPRFAEGNILAALEKVRVVAVCGPSQCGKTTLIREIGDSRGYGYVTLDDARIRSDARSDPTRFVEQLPARVILEEAHRAPELFPALQTAADEARLTGRRGDRRFLLTCSVAEKLVPGLRAALGGRMEMIPLHPLSQGELDGQDSDFLDILDDPGFREQRVAPMGNRELAERLSRGGYPHVQPREDRSRRRWCRSLVEDLVQRDVRDLTGIRRASICSWLMPHVAATTAGLLNVRKLGRTLDISLPTIRRYLSLLEQAFLLTLLPAWRSSRIRNPVTSPKLHIGDTSFACALRDCSADRLAREPSRLRPLLQTFVLQELQRQASWRSALVRFSHLRDRNGRTVDVVIERDARIAGVSVKLGETFDARKDFRGLRRLREAAGANFTAGALLYGGDACLSMGPQLYAVPLRMLWETPVGGATSGQLDLATE